MEDELLSREEVARLLNVGPRYLNYLLESGELPYVTSVWDSEKLVRASIALAYKREMKKRQAAGMEQMIEESIRLGLYEDELEKSFKPL